jgi:general stress protein 26
MTTPFTEIDARYSNPGTAATPWEDTRAALESAELFWICTVRADGRPHVTPLIAVWLDDAIHFCTGAEEQKNLNMAANQHVILMTGCNGWDAGLDVVVEGDAVRVTDDTVLKRLAALWTTKWDGRWQFGAHSGVFNHRDGGGQALVYSVRPAKVLAFAKGDFSHTKHVF